MSQRYEVPLGVEIAAQWAWRVIVIAIAALGIFWLLVTFAPVTVPIAVAILASALAVGAVDRLQKWGLPRLLASMLVVIFMVVLVAGLLSLVGQQLSTQFGDLRTQVIDGIENVREWARTGPLGLSDQQLSGYTQQAQNVIENLGESGVLEGVTAFGTTVTHIVAGFFIALFALFFFLYEGDRIWSFVVVLFPRNARAKVDSSGAAAWQSLTGFMRATVVVAVIDAVGVAIAALLLGVPLALALGVLVFLGAFVPIVGALLSGFIAVAVALVSQGPITALLMLLAVIGVQQFESHVLQPFLMGRFVAVHPLAIIVAIALGVSLGGIVGALVAVPLVACFNGVIRHLAAQEGTPLQPDGLPAREPPDDQRVSAVKGVARSDRAQAASTGSDAAGTASPSKSADKGSGESGRGAGDDPDAGSAS